MSLANLNRFAPGLCDIDSDQSASTIINIDTADTDDTGMPIDTSYAPEADMAEGASDVATAVESADTAEDLGEAVEATGEAVEALEAIARQRRGATPLEMRLIQSLLKAGAGKLYKSAPRRTLATGVFSAGIESATGDGGYSYVIAAIEEGKKSIIEWIKKQIQMVLDFFKGIFKGIGAFISGSKKLTERLTKLKERAGKGDSFAASTKTKVAFPKRLASTASSVAGIQSGLTALDDSAKQYLVDGKALEIVTRAFSLIQGQGAAATENENAVVAKFRQDAAALNGLGPTGKGGAQLLIGGFQLMTVSNPEEYKVTITTKTNDLADMPELPALSVADCSKMVDTALSILSKVEGYQKGWPERDKARDDMKKALEEFAKAAGKNYSEANGKAEGDDKDGMFKAYSIKKKISGAVGVSLMSCIRAEGALLSHCISVGAAAASLVDSSLKALEKEKSGEKKPEEKKPEGDAATA